MHTFEQYLALLQRYARRFVRADEDAEDLAHECLHAYRRRYGAYPWETEETDPSPIRWCLRKIHALAIDHYRRSLGRAVSLAPRAVKGALWARPGGELCS